VPSAPKCSYLRLPVNDISLDLNNPRIARILEMYGDSPSAEQIALALNSGGRDDDSGPSFMSLKQSILTSVHPETLVSYLLD
jgi:hypothetical protein